MNNDAGNWVYERMALLTASSAGPHAEDVDAALVRYRSYERTAKRRRQVRRASALAVVIVLVLAFAAPGTRGVARELWDRFYMRSPEAVRVAIPSSGRSTFIDAMISAAPPARFVADAAEAGELAGFAPRLPAALGDQLASGLAVLKVSGPIDVESRIHADKLVLSLHRRGIYDVNVPGEWDGVRISYHVGAGIIVAFLGGTFAQAMTPSIITPPRFAIIAYTEAALRAAGLSASDAHNARNLFVESGGGFAIVPSDARSRFRQVPLRTAQGLLFENDTDEDERGRCSFCAGPHELVLTWAEADRVFQLRSQTMTVNQAIELANAVN
jgi:hypothetical protein